MFFRNNRCSIQNIGALVGPFAGSLNNLPNLFERCIDLPLTEFLLDVCRKLADLDSLFAPTEGQRGEYASASADEDCRNGEKDGAPFSHPCNVAVIGDDPAPQHPAGEQQNEYGDENHIRRSCIGGRKTGEQIVAGCLAVVDEALRIFRSEKLQVISE